MCYLMFLGRTYQTRQVQIFPVHFSTGQQCIPGAEHDVSWSLHHTMDAWGISLNFPDHGYNNEILHH